MEFDKHFSVDEAQATLPLVKRIVEDIQQTGRRAQRRIAELGEGARGDTEVSRLVQELEDLGEELRRIGCDYKDASFTLGLIDFPAVIEGEEVLLCWRSDEPGIAFYHGLKEGYAGRKAIPDHLLATRARPGSGDAHSGPGIVSPSGDHNLEGRP